MSLNKVLGRELEQRPDWPPLSPPRDRGRGAGEDQGREGGVIVTETDPVRSKEQAFNSLFNTPNSSIHSAAAVSLNPPHSSPRSATGLNIVLLYLGINVPMVLKCTCTIVVLYLNNI